MRRKDREITDFSKLIAIMEKCDVCRLAFNDGDTPYIVPLNFGMEVRDGNVFLFFHSALKGKKIDLLGTDNRVAFEMDCGHQIILYDERMSCTMGYESVMGHGTLELLPESEKYNALKILMRHYHSEEFAFNTQMMKVTAVMRLTVSDMTGKRRDNIHPGENGRRIEM